MKSNSIIDIIKKHFEKKYSNDLINLIPIYAENDIFCDNEPVGFKKMDEYLLEFEINQNTQVKYDIEEYVSLTLSRIIQWIDKLENEGYKIKLIKKDKFYKEYKQRTIYFL